MPDIVIPETPTPDPTPNPTPSVTPNTDTDTQTVALSKVNATSRVTYSGKAQTPAVTVTDVNGQPVDEANYTVNYANNKAIGRASITVTGKGKYTGSVTVTFDIVPKGTKLSKVTAKKKAICVKWKKQIKQTTGYEIQYSTSKKFAGAKTKVIKKNKTTTVTIKKLKPKKKYYVRVRTYKTVKGKKFYY